MPANRIRVVNLNGATEREIKVPAAQELDSLEWSADGTSFFAGEDTYSNGIRLLHIDSTGQSQPLYGYSARTDIWGIPSPDGRHLATFKAESSANVWMVENP